MENNVSFGQEQQFAPQFQGPNYPFFVRLVIKMGLAKTQRQAEYVLIGVTVVALVLAAFLFMQSGGTAKTVTNADRARIEATTR